MKSEVLLAILKDLVSEIENTPTGITHGNADLGLSALIEEEEVQTLDDLFQELIEYARDEEEYELVSALEGVYALWHIV